MIKTFITCVTIQSYPCIDLLKWSLIIVNNVDFVPSVLLFYPSLLLKKRNIGKKKKKARTSLTPARLTTDHKYL